MTMALLWAVAIPTQAQQEAPAVELPEGEAKAFIEGTCVACHRLDYIPNSRGYTHEGWDFLIGSMIALPGDVKDSVVGYLAENFPKKPGTDPVLISGPVDVTRKALDRAGMSVSDINLFEINEAFASVVLLYMNQLEIPHDKTNVNGGAIAMGHPLGATGAMILGTLVDELERRDKEIGLATLCVGAGMGTATIVERV